MTTILEYREELGCEDEIFPSQEVTYHNCQHQQISSMTQKTPQDKKSLDYQGSSEAVIPCHPAGIKPNGNVYVASHNIKKAAGLFSYFADELLIQILEFVEPLSLIQLGATCKALWAFTRFEDLWRTHFVKYCSLLKSMPESFHKHISGVDNQQILFIGQIIQKQYDCFSE